MFKKLLDDSMFKAVFSDKKYMSWLLERFLDRKVDDYMIINKVDNSEVDNKSVIQLIKQELVTRNMSVKKKIVDLLVKRENEIIDLEVNNLFDEDVRKRNFAYLSNIYSNILEHGQDYLEQPKCIQINICNYIDYDYDNYCLLGENYNNKFIDNINFLVIDIAKYKKILYTDNKKLINKYAHIIIFDCDRKELDLLGKYNKMAKEIGEMVKKYNDDNIFSFMTDEESYERLYRTQMKRATMKGLEQGIEQGIERGIEKGMEQGIEQGYEQGFEQNRVQTAYSLLKENVSLDIISRTTGFSLDYLKSIRL